MAAKLGLINSVYFGSDIDAFGDGIAETKKIGFDTIDIYPQDGEMSQEQFDSVTKLTKEHDLPIRAGVALIFGFFSPNGPVREFAKEFGQGLVDLTADMGAHNMLIVNGEYFWQLETGFNKEWIFNNAVEGTKALGERAKERGIKIAVELEPFDMSIVRSIDSMEEFLDAVDMPDTVMANLDLAHLHLAGIPASEVNRLKGRVAHVHISDALDQHGDLPPGRGKVPLQGYVDALADIGFDGSVTIELEWPPDPTREGILAWITEAYESTAELMRNAGLRE